MSDIIITILVLLVFFAIHFTLLDKITEFFNKRNIGLEEGTIGSAWGFILLKSSKKGIVSNFYFIFLTVVINFIWYTFNFSLFFFLIYFFSKIYQRLT